MIKNKYLIDSKRGNIRKSTDEETPLLYEIEMDNGTNKGQILVSGDKRFPKVLAYMPVYNDSLYRFSPEPKIMTQIARNTLLKEIENYKEGTTRSSYTDEIHGELNVMVMPFCTTEWGEDSPYNNLLPEGWVEYSPGYDGVLGSAMYMNYYTGKPLTALAQIMAFLEPSLVINGEKIDWSGLKTDTKVTAPYNDMVASLFKYLYDITETQPVWGKSNNDHWPPTPVDAVIAMNTPIEKISTALSTCGLAADTYQDWNLQTVKNSIISIHPVFVGDAHNAFIVDGYAVSEDQNKDNSYLHCTFCRNGNFDGYYLIGDDDSIVFELNGLDYRDFTLKILPNVRNL